MSGRWFFSCTGNRLYAQCFDMKTGGLLWESEAELGKYTSSYANFLVLAGKKEIIIGWGENMAALSVDTGKVLATVTLQAEIADLYELSSGLFGFTLKNGYCAVGWRNAAGLMDSAAFDTTIDLPDTEKVFTPQYGLIQVYFTGSTIDGFSTLPLKEGGGMIICLSADERTAYVTSILPSPVLPEAVFLQAADAASVYGGSLLDITPQGMALTGWVKQSDGQGLNLVDTVNHTFSTLVIPDAETLKYCDQFSLTKDNRYIIAWNEGGRIYRIGADGQTETLALGEHVVLDKINDLEMVDAKYWADAARQTADMFPLLFVTIACGAVSGFHSLVSSGTASKQVQNEKHMLPISFGSMLLESLLAVVALVAVGAVSSGAQVASGTPAVVFASAISSFLGKVGIPQNVAFTLINLAVSAFALTSLDSVARVGRLAFQEFFLDSTDDETTMSPVKKFLTNKYTAIVATLVMAYALAKAGYANIWPLFGSANQLLSALALIACAVFLKRTNRKGWMLWVPMGVMLAVTLTALTMTILTKFGGIFAGTTANLGGDLLQGCFAIALFVLGVTVAVQGVKKLFGKKETVNA